MSKVNQSQNPAGATTENLAAPETGDGQSCVAPERIWIAPSARNLRWTDYYFEEGVEYVRADTRAVSTSPEKNEHDQGEMQTKTSSHSQTAIPKDNSLSASACPKCKGRHGYIAIIKTTVTGKWESRGISIERLQDALARGLLMVNIKCADCGGLLNSHFPLAAINATQSSASSASDAPLSVDTVAGFLPHEPKSSELVSTDKRE